MTRSARWQTACAVMCAALAFVLACFMCSAALASVEFEEGTYSVEVSLSGGSGKASVESPATLVVDADGSMTATVIWSSSNYDLMVVNGQEYKPVSTENGSTFEIPVAAFDEDIAVQAETTAMSEPHMIDYTLHFDSSTAKELKSGFLAAIPLMVAVAGHAVCIVAIIAILWAIRAGILRSKEGSE